jgi:hypothetical protein
MNYGRDDLFARYAVEMKNRNGASSADTDRGPKENLRRLAEHPVAAEFDLLSSMGDTYGKPNDSGAEKAMPQQGSGGSAYGTFLDLGKTASKYNKNSELVMSGAGTERETELSSTFSATGTNGRASSSKLSRSLAFTEQNMQAAPGYIPVSWTSEGTNKNGDCR